MIKTLTVTIKDINDDAEISIRGVKDELQFNPVVTLVTSVGQIAVDSQQLAKALAEVVNFQSEAMRHAAATVERQELSTTEFMVNLS